MSAKYGRLTPIKRVCRNKHGSWKWLFQCECGKKTITYLSRVRAGRCFSCGCLNAELIKTRFIKHGKCINSTRTSEYDSWLHMKDRSLNVNHVSYRHYGGRGITICNRWINSFANFYSDMGDKPTIKHTLDRINVNGNYEPSNCRWATRSQQMRNRRPLCRA